MKAAWVVVGLGYGDEGKGTIVDALVRKTGARVVVRFNGGAQAAHNVVAPDGRHHTFSQWGAGTFHGARTVLTKDFILHPLSMIEEAKHLVTLGISDPMSLVTVDDRALLTTPYHAAMNRIRELARGVDAHGSCGVGIGEAVADSLDTRMSNVSLRAIDLLSEEKLRWKLGALKAAKYGEAMTLLQGKPTAAMGEQLMFLSNEGIYERSLRLMLSVGRRINVERFDRIADDLIDEQLVLEGAQGILLDEWHGFHPHTTWSTTTSENARALLAVIGGYETTVIGVTRWYATRHGAGPFPTEQPAMDRPYGEHNQSSGFQGRFRVGWFDQVATKYAIESDGCIDALAVTCCDQVWAGNSVMCVGYNADRGRVLKIKARRNHRKDAVHLDEQRQLGEFLRTAVPQYDRLPYCAIGATIAEALGKPLLVRSTGPTCNEKAWFAHDALAKAAG